MAYAVNISKEAIDEMGKQGSIAVLIDRDGTMGGDYYVKHPQDYYAYEGTAEAFQLFAQYGIMAMIVTNQSCIARGLDGNYDFAKEFKEIGAVDWFICPHDTDDRCKCRKPETGLIEQAQKKYQLDLKKCYMIGDRWTDMLAGGKMGMRLVPVLTGRGSETLGQDRNKWADYEPVYIAQNLLDAAKWIVHQNCNV